MCDANAGAQPFRLDVFLTIRDTLPIACGQRAPFVTVFVFFFSDGVDTVCCLR